MDGIREDDYAKRKKGYRILALCFLIGLMFLIFENGVNHSPDDQLPYSNKIVYACFITVVPVYLLLRDRGILCPPGATCCGRKGGYLELFCYVQGEFWDYGMMGLCSVGVPVCVFWSAIACHDVQIELGHWVPFLGYMAYAGTLLYFSGPARVKSLNLQYAEGWLWIAWGIVFNVYFTPGSGGGLFYPLFHNGETSPRWAVDQQHIFQAALYIFVGAASIVLGKLGVRSGFPILLLGWNMYSMLVMHPQYCLLERDMHILGGQMFLVIGFLRYFARILEASFMMALLSGAFVFSTACTVTFADANFEEVSFVAVTTMIWGTWWCYIAYLFRDHWNIQESVAPEVNGSNNSKQQYSAVKPNADEDDDPLESGN